MKRFRRITLLVITCHPVLLFKRLKEFEARERKKVREYEKQTSKDLKRKDEEVSIRVSDLLV